jgi:cyclin B
VETIYASTNQSLPVVINKKKSLASLGQDSLQRLPSVSQSTEKPLVVKTKTTLPIDIKLAGIKPSVKLDQIIVGYVKDARDSKASIRVSTKAHIDLKLEEYDIKPTYRNYQDAPAYQYGRAVDIDERDSGDLLCVTAYVKEIYQYHREQEHRSVARPTMHRQVAVTVNMRTMLVDWLSEVHHKLKFKAETFYLTVNIIDRYLAKKTDVARNKFQLVGTTALLIASKYEDIYPAEINDLVEACDSEYLSDEIVECEKAVLETLNYQLSIPTIYTFLLRYLNAAHATRELCYLVSYIAECTLHSYGMMTRFKPSQLAAAAVLIGRKALGRNAWSPTLLRYSDYRREDVTHVAELMIVNVKQLISSTKLVYLSKKYGSKKFQGVATIKLPSEL